MISRKIACFIAHCAKYPGALSGMEPSTGTIIIKTDKISGQFKPAEDGVRTEARLIGSNDDILEFKKYLDFRSSNEVQGAKAWIADEPEDKRTLMLASWIHALNQLVSRYIIEQKDGGFDLKYTVDEPNMAGIIHISKTLNLKLEMYGEKEDCQRFEIDLREALGVCSAQKIGAKDTDAGTSELEQWSLRPTLLDDSAAEGGQKREDINDD